MDMKRTIALVLVCFMAIGLFGCVEKVSVVEKDQAVANAVAAEQAKAREAVQEKSDELSNKIDNLEQEKKTSEELSKNLREKVDSLQDAINDLQQKQEEVDQEIIETEAKEDLEDVDVELGDSLGNKVYDDGDIDKLFDGEIRFDGDNYDAHEELRTTTSLKPLYSLTGDEEFGSVAYLGTVDENSIEYRFVFEDTIDVSDIDRSEPLEINFLGVPLVITEVDNNGQDFEIRRAGEVFWIATGETKEVFGATIKLVGVTEDGDSAGIVVDGSLEWLDEGDSEEYEDIVVSLEKVIAIHSDSGGSAKLVITNTEDVYLDFDEGDSIVYDEKDKDAEWVYTLSVVSDELEYIGIKHNQKIDELDDDFLPKALGEGFSLPNDYVSIMFDSTNVDEYNLVTMEFDDVEDEIGTDYNGTIFLSEDDEGFKIDGEETDEIYAWYDSGVWKLAYLDDENEVIDATNDEFDIVFEDTTYPVYYNGNVNIGPIELNVTVDGGEFKYLGSEEEDAESGDILYNGIALGNKEYDVLGTDGIIILSPEDNADEDFVEILVPEDKLELTFTLG